MFALTQIVNSAIASLIVGLLFWGTSPYWWKWLQNYALSEGFRKATPLGIILLISVPLVLLVIFKPPSGLLEIFKPSQKTFKLVNPNMSNEEIKKNSSECEMKAIEVSTQIKGSGLSAEMERVRVFHRYKRLCLSNRGIELVPDNSEEVKLE